MNTHAEKEMMNSVVLPSRIGAYVNTTARILLGAVFLVFGIDGFLHFVPVGPSTPEAAQFIGSLMATAYVFPLFKVVEIVSGLLLLTNRAVPLALVLLAPIIINIAGYLFILNQAGQPMAIFLVGIEIFLAYCDRDRFKSLFVQS